MTKALETALLTTVNAPYLAYVDAQGLASSIVGKDVGLAQVGSFFTEIPVDQQLAFAEEHGVTHDALTQSAAAFQDYSGQDVALAA